MNAMKCLVLITAALVTFTGCGQIKRVDRGITESEVLELVHPMPTEDTQQRDALAAGLVAKNPEATTLLCGLLSSPAEPNDVAARYGLSALTHYTARPGGPEAERIVYATALIDALAKLSDQQNKAFLISQLQLVGKDEAIRLLGLYLGDPFLGDYAARALLTIGGPAVEAQFLQALKTATEANAAPLIKALGQIRSRTAVRKIRHYATHNNRPIRETALYALANIGEPSSETVLRRAAQTKNAYDRAQYTSLYLLFATRRAEEGDISTFATICHGIIQDNADDTGIRTAALNTLRTAVGTKLDRIKAEDLRQQIQSYMGQFTAGGAVAPPPGFISLFNGRDLSGWKRHDGLPGEKAPTGKWAVQDGAIVGMQDPPGKGGFLTTTEIFRDFELQLETKVEWPFDTGVFLRVGPAGRSHQVTLDYRDGGEIGGIYCPWTHGFVFHCPDGIQHFRKDQWNKLRITCIGQPARIRVWLNDTQITDFQHTEESTAGIPEEGTLCLQVHPGGEGYDASRACFRNIFVRRLNAAFAGNVLTDQEKAEGFVSLFNGRDLSGWIGATQSYGVKDGVLFCRRGTGRNIYTAQEYDDFVLRFEFKLEPGTNNGLGIRTPPKGDAAYAGMELQILDNTAEKYKHLHDWQYHGSIYGIVPAKRGYLKPVGSWNYQEVVARGKHIAITLNGTTIVDADIAEAAKNGTLSGKKHPGLLNESGHIGFLGHGDYVEFRNIRLRSLE